MITRRSLLKAGVGTAAVVAVGGVPGVALAAQPNWEALRQRLTGQLFLPADAGYPVAKEVQYAQYGAINPAAVAFCETVADVQACVTFARSNGLPATPRSGGHSLGGYSLSPGLIIDVSKLSAVKASGRGVSAGAGAAMIDLMTGLSALGLAIPQAPEPTVGTGGFVQGGGVGFESRRFGLAADNLLAADVVLADGSFVRCSERRNEDLFWALRGAGGGNFGIVTRFEFQPVPIPMQTNFVLTWSGENVREVQQAWQDWLINSSRDINGSLLILLGNVPDSSSASASASASARTASAPVPSVVLVGSAVTGLDQANSELDALVSAVGVQPTFRSAQQFGRQAGMLDLFDCSSLTVSQCHREGTTSDGELPTFGFTIERNRLFDHGISASAFDLMLEAYETGFADPQIRLMEFVGVGGAINDVGRTETAYVHRTSQFFMRTGFGLPTPTPSAGDVAAGHGWIDALFSVVNRFSDAESYQNFIDPGLQDWRTSYYAENYPRLKRVKRHYDPDNFFQFAQSIKP
jgi:FAD/FMN-containing dehydrogenase